ncbi:outer membrane lipoprotein carrier protein LolA [Gelidibacter salicanalis]|uniref:Outer membrane lipoprotein carrier protein LolA n=1 Tax=Gelidibacter salicanalis TaxID=291193 RepID=A0A5C7AK95_9FLAO|nr:outer membrane lipoprotein carrier protein LolA [Gelidibacter salicanalis]TXE08344.1 outer membrane lipoprotein carrier protein LolA [Gelidibacter salicanalis]
MNTKQYIFTLAVTFLFAISAMSQTKLSASEQKEFKAKVQNTAKNTQTIVSDFTQTKHLSVMDNAIASEGKLVFKAPNLVKWEYVKPYQNSAIFKDDQLLVNNEGKKDQIDLSSNKIFKSLNTLIVNSIKGDMFDETQFDLAYFKINEGYLVKFIPKDKRMKKFMASFELKFSKSNGEVQEVKLIEPNDDYTLITFANRKINTSVSENAFIN